jgi:hypothetical protein
MLDGSGIRADQRSGQNLYRHQLRGGTVRPCRVLGMQGGRRRAAEADLIRARGEHRPGQSRCWARPRETRPPDPRRCLDAGSPKRKQAHTVRRERHRARGVTRCQALRCHSTLVCPWTYGCDAARTGGRSYDKRRPPARTEHSAARSRGVLDRCLGRMALDRLDPFLGGPTGLLVFACGDQLIVLSQKVEVVTLARLGVDDDFAAIACSLTVGSWAPGYPAPAFRYSSVDSPRRRISADRPVVVRVAGDRLPPLAAQSARPVRLAAPLHNAEFLGESVWAR